jgi:hypothetical protein
MGERTKTAIWVLVLGVAAVSIAWVVEFYNEAAEEAAAKAAQQKALVRCLDQVLATAPDEEHRRLGAAWCVMENPEPPSRAEKEARRCLERHSFTAPDAAQRDLEAEKCFDKYLGPPPTPRARDPGSDR